MLLPQRVAPSTEKTHFEDAVLVSRRDIVVFDLLGHPEGAVIGPLLVAARVLVFGGDFQQTAPCPRCDGEGELASDACGECGGDGRVRREATLSVEIPAGIRDGDDLRYDHAVSFPQAALGDTVEVPTLDGAVELDVPAGTQSGERFRLDGKGMPHLEGRGRGDLYVTVRVVTLDPDELNTNQREALERFAEASDDGDGFDLGEDFFDRIADSIA
jgi:molecular chaperone DnaJ